MDTRQDARRPDILRDAALRTEWLRRTGAPEAVAAAALEELRRPVAALLDARLAGGPLPAQAIEVVNARAAGAPPVAQLREHELTYVYLAAPTTRSRPISPFRPSSWSAARAAHTCAAAAGRAVSGWS
jgi:hypothetical protein